jgi:hypothetical protein
MVSNDLLAQLILPFLGLIIGLIIIVIIIAIAIYIYTSLALMKIAKRTGTKNPWLAWIPIANVYLMTQVARLPGYYTWGLLAVFVPIIGGLAVAALMAYIWWKISEELGRPGWWGIICIIPFFNLIVMGIMAWGDTGPKTKKTNKKKKK